MHELLSLAGWCGGFAFLCAIGEVVWAALANDQDAESLPDPDDVWAPWQDSGEPVGRVER